MNIERKTAIAFLLVLGFKSADGWDNEKIASRLTEVPNRLTPESEAIQSAFQADSKMEDIYKELATAVKAEESVTVEGMEPEPEKEKETKVDSEVAKPAKKSKKNSGGKKPSSKKKAKSAKTPKDKKSKKQKTSKTPKVLKLRDQFGSLVSSIRGKINAALTKDYQTGEEIAKAAGVSLWNACYQCRVLTRAGAVEKLRTIAFRLVPEQKKKAA